MAGEQRRVARKGLSKSILEMKFMQKSKEAARKEAEAAEGRAACETDLSEAMRLGGARILLEPSFTSCEDMIAPRISFHGANPEIEKLLEQEKENTTAVKTELDAEVPAAEVARVTHAGSKLQPPRKRARFIKPKDDD